MSRPLVVFIHGLWIHASAWAPWQAMFDAHGYDTLAPGWPGEAETVDGTRADPEAVSEIGIEAIHQHYARLIADLPVTPFAVGHSFGGLIAQELLADDLVAAAAAIDPAPVKGVRSVPLPQLRSSFPVLRNPANRHRAVSLNAKQFRYAFGNALSEDESNRLHQTWTIPSPGRPLFEDASAGFARHSPAAVDTRSTSRGPLLLTSGSVDHTVPRSVTLEVYRLYEQHAPALTEYHEFLGKGHSLTIDSGWEDVARVVLDWLEPHRAAAPPVEHRPPE